MDISLNESDGEERRAKSLRNGVHDANGVVYGDQCEESERAWLLPASHHTSPPATAKTNASPRKSAAAVSAWSGDITLGLGSFVCIFIRRPPGDSAGAASTGDMID